MPAGAQHLQVGEKNSAQPLFLKLGGRQSLSVPGHHHPLPVAMNRGTFSALQLPPVSDGHRGSAHLDGEGRRVSAHGSCCSQSARHS